jgi:hypothetical protein
MVSDEHMALAVKSDSPGIVQMSIVITRLSRVAEPDLRRAAIRQFDTVNRVSGRATITEGIASEGAAARIGHAKPWAEMTTAERRAFQHSYSRHGAELGLPDWAETRAPELQGQFNNVVGYVRQNGTQLPGPIYKPWNANTVKVNYFEWEFRGTKYYYYEDAATGTFISAGKARP